LAPPTPAAAAPPRATVLVVDDEPQMVRAWRKILETEGENAYAIRQARSGSEALDVLTDEPIDVAVVDVQMPGMSGMELLDRIKRRWPDVEVVIMTAYGGVDLAVQAVKAGAYDFLTKPFESIHAAALVVAKAVEHQRLVRQNRRLAEALAGRAAEFEELVGQSGKMAEVFRLVKAVAPSQASVLIQGESGTGKELVARAIHLRSSRRERPFVVVNCTALTETLLESELFGHVKGAFTGALTTKPGLFVAADGGSLLLDEVGDMPPPLQAKLLRVLQSGEVRPVGSNETTRVDVRMLAATNVDLKRACARGAFREDLYYRLNVVGITLPPLRERPEDIPLLAYHFLHKHAQVMGREVSEITPGAMEALLGHPWRGNVRELGNVIERAVVLGQGPRVDVSDLGAVARAGGGGDEGESGEVGRAPATDVPYAQAREQAVSQFERRYVSALLKRALGNVSEAARLAGLDRSNFRRVMRRAGLKPEDYKE